MARSRMAHRTPRTRPDGSATRRTMRDRNATATPSPAPPSARVTLVRPPLPPPEPTGDVCPSPPCRPFRTRPNPVSPRPAARCAPGSAARWPATWPPRPQRLPRRRDAGRRQDHVRAAGGRGAARGPDDHRRHGRHAHRAPQAPVGGGRGVGRDRARPGLPQLDGRDVLGLHRHRVTYAGVAAHPVLHRDRTETRRTLVILDEVHHAGDARSWGEGVREAFEPATRRLTLTGTPFRSDDNPIPFVDYEPDADGLLRSRADHAYGYAEALADGVVRPVVFLAYSGASSWRTSAGEEITARLGEPLTAEQTARAWRTALDPGGEWIPAVLAAADRRLTGHRTGGMPDAGGLVIATDQTTARAYAEILRDITGTAPVVVLSDEAGASDRIAAFASPTTGGWWPSGWCPRASTCRASPSASTPPARRPRCSSPRPSAGSCGRGGRGRRRRCSCPASRCCWGWPASWRPSATTCWASRTGPRRSGTTRSWRRRTGSRTSRARTRSRSPRCAPTPSWTS